MTYHDLAIVLKLILLILNSMAKLWWIFMKFSSQDIRILFTLLDLIYPIWSWPIMTIATQIEQIHINLHIFGMGGGGQILPARIWNSHRAKFLIQGGPEVSFLQKTKNHYFGPYTPQKVLKSKCAKNYSFPSWWDVSGLSSQKKDKSSSVASRPQKLIFGFFPYMAGEQISGIMNTAFVGMHTTLSYVP